MAVNKLLNHEDFVALADEILSRGEQLRFKARGNSMNPFIRSGDMLIVRPTRNGKCIQIGDVLLCHLSSEITVAHRLRAIRPDGLLIQGDACEHPDGLIFPEDILGRVVAVESNGRLISPNSFLALLWLFVAPLRPLLLRGYRFVRWELLKSCLD